MTFYFPGPYIINFFYTTTVSSLAIQHKAVYNLDLVAEPTPGDTFDTITPVFPAGHTGSVTLDEVIDQWVLSFKEIYSTTGGNVIDRAELWKVAPSSFDASFLSAYTINVAGTTATAPVGGGQTIVTMRTTAGGVAKFNFMESVISPGITDPGTIANAALETLISEVEDGDYPWTGRDNGYPFVRIACYPGQNERLWKKRFRAA